MTLTALPTTSPSTPYPSATATAYGLSAEQLDELGREMDELRARIAADLGQADVDYLRRVIRLQRGMEVAGRAALFLGWLPPMWVLGTAALSVSKILDNMEIGHNVMHGQYEWTRDPDLAATAFEWDNACPGDQWRHSHNYLHHTFTNVVGRDRDIGYGALRMSEQQRWHRYWIANPAFAFLLAALFEHGVMLHDVEIDEVLAGRKPWSEAWPTLQAGLRKDGRQALKDYVIWPALTGPLFLSTLAANASANVVRNLWAFTIIFCGHFPDGTHEFDEAEIEDESKGHWYFRQMLGSANLSGGRLLHLLSGNLSHQIEHHLFPDLPARRYAELAPDVRAICGRYGLPYNTGSLAGQFGSVVRKIVRLARPDRRAGDGPPAPGERSLAASGRAAAVAA